MMFRFSVVLFMTLGFVTDSTSARQPNVVLVLTDDQGFGDVRSHGNELIDTPVHDRLAREGARFDRFTLALFVPPREQAF